MKRVSEKWDEIFYKERMKDENVDSSIRIEFETQCDIVAAMEFLEIEIHQLKRKIGKRSRIIRFKDEQPPNDYDYQCWIVDLDGSESLSDGGTVHDINKTLGILGWRKIIK